MAASVGVFPPRGRSGSKLNTVYDADGNEVEVEIREDEEQNIKLQETIELLLAAGYFRARIKGLSPFDKVVGGMTWCIRTCNFDLDVDLLFEENSTIGQKIALTEKIVAVLPRMKCPHRIEPHQIQGLDFIHIYPVVQWLVKKAIETREEMGDTIRAYSISQFDKHHKIPKELEEEKEEAEKDESLHKPQRKYRRHDAHKLKDEETRVQCTLLEYGWKYAIPRGEHPEMDEESEAKKKIASSLGEGEDDEEAMREEEQGRLTASAVGSIVGLQSQEIQQIASEYAGKAAEISKMEKSEKVGGVQQHKRMTAALQKQIQQSQSELDEVKKKHSELQEAYKETKLKLQEVEEYSQKINEETAKLEEVETEENQEVLQSLRSLVAMNENLKKQEQEFRAHCKEEMARLQGRIQEMKVEISGENTEEQERYSLIQKQYDADKEKLHKIRLLLARKNREIAGLQRKIDEVPTRAELSQYQRRFVELYDQVYSKHRETKQFYTLYNTLDDTKLYLNKEVNLLNSIHDSFEQAMASQANKDQFLRQFEQIVEGVKQNRMKVEKKKQDEKVKRDQLNEKHLDLVEKQRAYFKTVKDFKEECRKNEILLQKLKSAGLE